MIPTRMTMVAVAVAVAAVVCVITNRTTSSSSRSKIRCETFPFVGVTQVTVCRWIRTDATIIVIAIIGYRYRPDLFKAIVFGQ